MFRKALLNMCVLMTIALNRGNAQGITEYPNGLIYHDTTMRGLQTIVDSMNLKFKKCDTRNVYYSVPQARCNYVKMDSGDVAGAKRDIENQIAFEDFCKKYPYAKIDRRLPGLQNIRHYDDSTWGIEYSVSEFNDNGYRGFSNSDTSLQSKNLEGKWVFVYWAHPEYKEEHIIAFYFDENFRSMALPEKYARMVQYVDYMIDTESTVYLKTAEISDPSVTYPALPLRHAPLPTPKSDKLEDYLKRNDQKYDSEEFKSLLTDAINEMIKQGRGNERIEELSEKYDSKAHALQLKRGRIVVGSCSDDPEPAKHAMQIARLAAESMNREIFLRAHLDILNERNATNPDGSYDSVGRHTYIKELEQLNFDVIALILGITLMIENPAPNHYSAKSWRLARALSESSNAREAERKLTEGISDNRLDNLNRILLYSFYRYYIYYITDPELKKQNIDQLRTAVATMPSYIAEKIKIKDEDFGNQYK